MPAFRLILTFILSLMIFGALPAQAEITVTDILGREVTIPKPAEKIVLGEGRHMAVLGLLHDDPVSKVVGWRLDKALDKPTMNAYREKFPAIDAIRSVGSGNRDISAETIIALEPDLLVLSLMDDEDPAMSRAREQIEAAGIPVVYVDFFSHPQANSVPSLRMLGKLTGATDRAEEFAEFYEARLNHIRNTLEKADPERPSVFFHVHAAPQNCCATIGNGVFHDFVTTAGGKNLGADVVQGVLGNVSLEYLISANPDFYVATGGTHMAARGGLVLGSEVSEEDARNSFHRLIHSPGFQSLRAVKDKDAIGVWHLFNDTPAHIALIEYLAKAFHPDLFADLDPEATLREIRQRFSPVDVPGTWWIREQR